ncbi:hypothetical protein ACFLRT_05750 [Acidobacteriota bacterium]
MKTINKKLHFHFAIYTIFLTFCFTADLLWGESKSIIWTQEQLKKEIKVRYKYEEWRPKIKGIIQGVAISRKTLEELKFMLNVWEKDDYRILTMKGVPNPMVGIRKCWAENKDELEVTMVVGHTCDDMKKYLFSQFLGPQNVPQMVRKSNYDQEIGDFCRRTPGEEEGTFSIIYFIRNNVVIIMRALGCHQIKLRDMAKKVDCLLIENGTVSSYSCLKDIPYVKLARNQKPLKLGMSMFLISPDKKLRYFWKLTGGGVENDSEGNFVYYAGDLGKQTITVTAVNEHGLQYSDTIKIDVER